MATLRIAPFVAVLVIVGTLKGQMAPDDACSRRDYPVPTQTVDYGKAFTSDSVPADELSINGKVLRIGAKEKEITNVLGTPSSASEDWETRSEMEQCEYLLDLLRAHPNSMYLYKLKGLQLEKMSGMFRVTEWNILDVGKLQVFFNKPNSRHLAPSYLFNLTLQPSSLRNVEHETGQVYVKRDNGITVKWHVRTNAVSISTGATHR